MAEGKKTKSTADVTRPRDNSVGEMLRAARIAKNLSIEDVSVALRIRASQLRVIEANNIDALPGMTYAVGFVRSYANFVGLDGVEVAHAFKAAYGQGAGQSKLSFPAPVEESRMPDPIMVGIGAFLAIVALVLWTVYSNAHNGIGKVAEQIPPAPAVTTTSEAPAESLLTAPVSAAVPAAVIEPDAAVIAPPEGEEKATLVSGLAPAAAESHEDASAPAVETQAAKPVEKTPAPAADKKQEKKHEKEASPVININRSKSRVMLQSSQSSWVQITDVSEGVIFKKVLNPGEQYYVPDQPGLSLVTANAGGLDVYVDGQQVQALGRPGEIVRGVVLDPIALKKKKIRVNE